MQNGKYGNLLNRTDRIHSEIPLSYLLQLLIRNKLTIIIAVLSMLGLATIYNFTQPPIYKASALLKKETGNRKQDNVDRIIEQRSFDEISTDIQILKSRSVLEKVIDELKLNVIINEIISPEGNSHKYEIPLIAYQFLPTGIYNPALDFSEMQISEKFTGKNFQLKTTRNSLLELYDYDNNRLLKTEKDTLVARFTLPQLHFSIDCSNILPGSQLFFQVEDPNKTIINLSANISANSITNTDLITVSVKSSSPRMAQLMVNTLVEKFRETVLEKNRQTAIYSFDFVNQHLEEISEKLKKVEADLSAFKSKNRIVATDKASMEVIESLSNLEAQKITTELELAENQSRYNALVNELKSKGHFDQTFLTPTKSDRDDPFSILLRQLSDAEVERLELLQKRTEKHPDIRAIDSRIQEIKNKLKLFNQNTINTYQIIINSLKKKLSDLDVLIARYEIKIENLPQFETKLMNLTRQKNVYEKMFVMLLDKREEMRMAVLSTLQNIVIVDPADLPRIPVAPRKRLNLILGVILGISIAFVTIILKEFRKKTIRNLTEIEDLYKIPILAILPKYTKAIRKRIKEEFTLFNHIDVLTDNQLGFKESYMMLYTKLSNFFTDKKIIMFTSCEENSGKTTISTNFSVSLILTGKKILLIECDLRKPKFRHFFNLPPHAEGLIDFLKNDLFSEPKIYRPSIINKKLFDEIGNHKTFLDVVPAGGIVENSSALLRSEKFKNWLNFVSPYYDYIIIDTPPLTRTSDVFSLGNFLKEIILVINPRLTIEEGLLYAHQNLKRFKMNLLGCVVNGCEINALPDRYRYGYGYGYGYGDEKEAQLTKTST